jgi:hypothetical protein
MNRRKITEPNAESSDIDRLWDYFKHEDNLLATRVSVFLLAQSILIAVTASLINTVVGLSRSPHSALRPEIFGLTIAIILAGLSLTLIFWYVFTLNFDNIGITIERMKVDPLYIKLLQDRAKKRQSHWYFRLIFQRKGMNWIITNGLPVGLIFLWCIIGAFLLAVFLSP